MVGFLVKCVVPVFPLQRHTERSTGRTTNVAGLGLHEVSLTRSDDRQGATNWRY